MSRVYEALQQCFSDQVTPGTLQESRTDAVFSKQLGDSVWNPNTAPTVQPNLSNQGRLPALFSTYSYASEQFRLLATRLQQMQLSRAFKSVLVTSTVAGEGKSLLMFNLAVSLAQGGRQKVLLVDADLRKSGLSLDLGVDGHAGMREWHQSKSPISEFIWRVADLNVWVLPAGLAMVDPLELLKSRGFTDILNSLNAAFDWVLVDSPPLLPLADAEIISRICDGTIVVVRRNKSPKSGMKQALERVPPSKMVGFLLNEFPAAATYGYPQYITK